MKEFKEPRLKVLIVEDDQIAAYVAKMLMEKLFDIEIVNNGYDAIEAVIQNKYDLILMDINLGDINMDGIKTMRAIRNLKNSQGIKIVALTVYNHSLQWFLDQGFDDLVRKPVVIEKLQNRITGYQPNYRNN